MPSPPLYISVSYRIQIANVAILATPATDHCTLLHAGRRQSFGCIRDIQFVHLSVGIGTDDLARTQTQSTDGSTHRSMEIG